MSLSYGLLGLLNYFPMSGYDLKKIFDDSINFFWAAKTSQIYRELKSLERKGHIASKIHISEKGPNKRVYDITKQGAQSLKKWLENPPKDLREDQRNAFLIRVLHSSQTGFDRLRLQITARRLAYQTELRQLALVEKKLQEYLKLSGKQENLPYWKIVLSRGRHVTQANLAWANETIRYLERLPKKERS